MSRVLKAIPGIDEFYIRGDLDSEEFPFEMPIESSISYFFV